MPQFMFASNHDLLLALVLLIFAGLIATSFGVFVATSVTNGLNQLAKTAQKVANGDFSARIQVAGRDEVAQTAVAFNKMAGQLEAVEKERGELEEMRRDLIAWVSHDLRTPLTSIRVLVEALHDGIVTDDETQQRYYKTIRSDVVALNELINDLFELAQLDAGLTMNKSLYSLNDLVMDSVKRFRDLGNVKGIKIAGITAAKIDPILIDGTKISRVLSNLLSNAIRYTPENGEIRIHLSQQNGQAQVTVQDNGAGFKEADLPRIFEKFYRGEEARSRSTGGAGLGLAIARSIVEAHAGNIWAKNLPDAGAEVSFSLPMERHLPGGS